MYKMICDLDLINLHWCMTYLLTNMKFVEHSRLNSCGERYFQALDTMLGQLEPTGL